MVGVGQYWANVTDGRVHIPRVKAGTYRLTLYAEGVFGQYEQDDVVVQAGDGQGPPFQVNWTPESHGARTISYTPPPLPLVRDAEASQVPNCGDSARLIK